MDFPSPRLSYPLQLLIPDLINTEPSGGAIPQLLKDKLTGSLHFSHVKNKDTLLLEQILQIQIFAFSIHSASASPIFRELPESELLPGASIK